MRIVLGGLIGCLLVGGCLFAVGLSGEPTLEGPCPGFLAQRLPKQHWVKLTGCRLEVDALLVGNADGVERFADRAEGVSRVLHATTPVWTHAWAPVTTGRPGDLRAVRAVVRLVDVDLLAWLNAVERADPAQRERLLDDQGILLRIAKPGLVMGHATRAPEAEALQAALGTGAQAGLLVIEPGTPPPDEVPMVALAAGLLGGASLLWTLSQLLRRGSVEEAIADATALNVSDVKLSLGELDALRQDEARARREKPPE